MPFDGTPVKSKKPDLRILRDVLWDGEGHPLWPSGFKFDYSHAHSCAIGISFRLWSVKPTDGACEVTMARMFDMNIYDAERIFYRQKLDITAKELGDKINDYLKGQRTNYLRKVFFLSPLLTE